MTKPIRVNRWGVPVHAGDYERILVALLAALALAGCVTKPAPEPEVVTVTVHDPVPISCVPRNTPPAIVYPDTAPDLLALPGAISRARAVESGWGDRDVRLKLLEGIVAACRGPAAPLQ